MRQRSKNDLENQIYRIYRLYGMDNPHYMKAQNIVLRYNHNMSEHKTNKVMHQKYMGCYHYCTGIIRKGMEDKAQWCLEVMGKVRYPQSVFMRQ